MNAAVLLEWVASAGESLRPFIVETTVKSTVILTAALILTSALRRAAPAVRHSDLHRLDRLLLLRGLGVSSGITGRRRAPSHR